MNIKSRARESIEMFPTDQKYPRVLIIYISCINKSDAYGLSLRNWFAEWPKENLAQIYSGGEVGREKFCGHTFKLGLPERRFGRLFYKIKRSPLGDASRPINLDGNNHNVVQMDVISIIRNRLSEILLDSGLWEIVFKINLSSRLLQWVSDFKPEVIYCQGYTLSFAWLPIMLHKKFGIPICFQTGDDWPDYLYKNSIFSWFIRPIVHRTASDLMTRSSKRFASGDSMATEYIKRYKVPYKTMMIGDNLYRFRQSSPIRVVEEGNISVVYTGSLYIGRWKSLIDLCNAAEALRTYGFNIMVTAFASNIPKEGINTLIAIRNLQILPSPAHDLVPAYLKGADILFLPETFDLGKLQKIRFSISTKAHLYMMSERPILLYASPFAGVTDYAKRDGWAYVVDQPSTDLLIEGLRQLISNKDISNKLVGCGIQIALKNHDENKIRQQFLSALRQIAISS